MITSLPTSKHNNFKGVQLNSCQIRAVVFRAQKFPNYCEEYMRGHAAVLRAFGIEPNSLRSYEQHWQSRRDVFVFMLFSTDDEPIAGVRIERKDGGGLAFEKSLEEIGPEYVFMAQVGSHEICGLWNSVKHSGRLLSYLVARCAIDYYLCNLGGGLYNFASHHTRFVTNSLGFRKIVWGVHGGDIPYPSIDYLTNLLKLDEQIHQGNSGQNSWLGEDVFWNGEEYILLSYEDL